MKYDTPGAGMAGGIFIITSFAEYNLVYLLNMCVQGRAIDCVALKSLLPGFFFK